MVFNLKLIKMKNNHNEQWIYKTISTESVQHKIPYDSVLFWEKARVQ